MNKPDKISVFDENAQEYDTWYEKHASIYQSELQAVKKAVPEHGTGIEIGVGTGRFALPLGIKMGVEPSESMAKIAAQRGIQLVRAFAENLPLKNTAYDYALMVTTDCFLSDIPKAFSEVNRILKPAGIFILGIIDRKSPLGRKYEVEKSHNKFYKDAHFHTTQEVTQILKQTGFHEMKYWQTLKDPSKNEIENPVPSYGTGSFVVIKAIKSDL